jgi:hypothetical protein
MHFVMRSQHFRLKIKWLKLGGREPKMNNHCVRSVLLLYLMVQYCCDTTVFPLLILIFCTSMYLYFQDLFV